MIQGVASNVGKSLLVTALCRIMAQDGWRVAPFKAWNMALNSYVTEDGREIGRAQGIQAEAAGITATGHMNPFLLKPKGNMQAQVIVRGRPWRDAGLADRGSRFVKMAMEIVAESLAVLRREYDVVIIEGAGSPAEINLKERDIANMRTAQLAQAPVLLAADIDRGGALAALVGTMELLDPEERRYVAGLLINKFRGDPDILRPGLEVVEQYTGRPVVGVVPYISDIYIDNEDSVSLETTPGSGGKGQFASEKDLSEMLQVAVIHLPHISNFTDFAPLQREPGVRVLYVRRKEELEQLQPDWVILPGTKNTTADLTFLRESGLADVITELAQRGRMVTGICGGYQMLGRWLRDPAGYEGTPGTYPGLGLLPISTTFQAEKTTVRAEGRVAAVSGWWEKVRGVKVEGYEIHTGTTAWEAPVEEPFRVIMRAGKSTRAKEGTSVAGGQIWGTYWHGIFDNDLFRHKMLAAMRDSTGQGRRGVPVAPDITSFVRWNRQEEYDRLAEAVRAALDLEKIYAIVEKGV